MLTIIGTVPLPEKLYTGEAHFVDGAIKVGDCNIPIERGTGALIAAALRIMEQYGSQKPYCILAGDRSSGTGSRLLLEETVRFLPCGGAETVVLHYMFILLKYGAVFAEAVKQMQVKPYLIADAGGMYMAKASGIAGLFDIFTPDRGELAFLADAKAAHPMYTNTEYLAGDNQALIDTARQHHNIPRTVIVKGRSDAVFEDGQLTLTVTEPSVASMEAMGGTGDTVTGMVAAFRYLQAGNSIYNALLLNRLAGQRLGCTPRTRIGEFIKHLDLSYLTKVGVSL